MKARIDWRCSSVRPLSERMMTAISGSMLSGDAGRPKSLSTVTPSTDAICVSRAGFGVRSPVSYLARAQ